MRLTNYQFSKKDRVFLKACKLAKVEPTVRQASKFRMGKGLSSTVRARAVALSNQDVISETFKSK